MDLPALLGKKLKDDDVMELLDRARIAVVYDFDRSHENIPDRYWAPSKKDGFQLGFDADQVLNVIFVYAMQIEGFEIADPSDCGVQFFSTIDEARTCNTNGALRATNGTSELLGIRREWVRFEYEKHFVRYEFRGSKLAVVTIWLNS